ncbi:hypothetical protein PVAP13_9KG384301 [Panicum virgatum]|uniref:Uncharacterized protein n=1 Tax=Panicum virgatum TaxID=38727 RepID=A0A8T0N4R2_PANVG|nr:hypothetical protein PVAP13_9KG384301 [Panicum virgatum]
MSLQRILPGGNESPQIRSEEVDSEATLSWAHALPSLVVQRQTQPGSSASPMHSLPRCFREKRVTVRAEDPEDWTARRRGNVGKRRGYGRPRPHSGETATGRFLHGSPRRRTPNFSHN